MSEKAFHVTSVSSHHATDRLDAEAHEVDLAAVTSHQFSLNEVAGELTLEQKFYILKRLEFGHLESLDDMPPSAVFMMEKIQELDLHDAENILTEFLKDHNGDVNIPMEDYDFIELLTETGSNGKTAGLNQALDHSSADEKQEAFVQEHSITLLESNDLKKVFDRDLQLKTEAALVAYWSPYPEVRAVTDPFDDPSIPCETFRAYLVGIIWVVLGTFINEYFMERQPPISLGTAAVQLFVYPSGKLAEWILPAVSFKVWKYNINLNPGPWSHKEQLLATLFYSVSGGAAYASYFIILEKLDIFYGNPAFTIGTQFLLVLTSNFMGFGLAGLFRKFVVYPVTAIWPTLLPNLAINKALVQPEKKEKINGWVISRYSFFLIVFAASFFYFWIPDYLFTALSTFNWISWAAPNNLNVATITGSQTGLGLNPITTFDWNIINNTPLAIPFFAQLNAYIGSLVGFVVIVALWWTNYKWTAYLPINSNQIFTNTGEPYAVREVLNSEQKLDQAKYEEIGPPFYTAANLVVYGTFFALYPMNFVYVLLTQFKQIKVAVLGLVKSLNFKKARSTYQDFDDPFSTSMKKYPEVPEWWFTIILVITVVLSIITVEVYKLQTPVWTIFFAIAMNFVFLLPFAVVYAATGTQMSINVLLEMIMGYALPGNGTALNYVKTLGTNIDVQAENYITNQKQAHYLRIPPRSLFRAQLLSVIINSLMSVGVLNLAINEVQDFCHPHQPQKFTCPGSTTVYSASVLWGVIGPKKVFGGLYPILQWCFLIGFLLAFPCWALKKYYGRTIIGKYFHPIVFCFGIMIYAPYNLSYYTPGMILSFFFMYVIRKNYTAWWEKYTYILSGGLNGGIAFSSIIIFFAVQYHEKDISWWGNNVNNKGLDAMGPSLRNATAEAPGGYFGPRKGNFP
ncbi:OPT family small oligopeptide transporter [Candidozyma pseudohaemuli]|uniref:OPT family small oligopeptide transporter n=1 Tax=Candidozyma pseudohaemuli TaxID=418784 RepID=A0A2P7YP31_9ASCO|nr:OPT family small oligopeptide transporter [[Candida] pseudohaemulonii]PSK37700.1 OPT family small oligopeptide transporter [[Candida] pseudohaemulonii]